MRIHSTILLTLVLLFGVANSPAQTSNVNAVAHEVDDHYNHLKSFKASFTEIYQGPGISRNESGTLWLKKPGRMRWEYHVPREKLFLIDSQHAYFYVTGEHQARKTPVKSVDDIRSPLRYLLGKNGLDILSSAGLLPVPPSLEGNPSALPSALRSYIQIP